MGLLNSEQSDKKPLFRQWYKSQKNKGIDPIEDIIDEIRLSSSEEWILIEGVNSVALLNAESKVGQDFWKAIQPFKGELKALKIVPAKGKLGFDIEIEENLTVIWEWSSEGLSRKKSSTGTVSFLEKFSLENMKPTDFSGMSMTKSSNNGTKPSRKNGKSKPDASPQPSVETRGLEPLDMVDDRSDEDKASGS